MNWPDPNLPPINLYNAPVTDDSPCIQVCKMTGGVCQGCGRTLDEIAQWPMLTRRERMQINERLKRERSTEN